jgi:hypothetical protein
MDKNHHIWRIWMNTLHRWGVEELTASFLEAAGAFSIIAAQLIYLGQPILSAVVPSGYLIELTSVLENDDHRSEFIKYLREER